MSAYFSKLPLVSFSAVTAKFAFRLGVAFWGSTVGWAQLPESPSVVAGDVAVSTTPTQMTVSQTTTHGIVNWNSFSIGAGQGVHFNNGTGATLNRVTGLTASQIDGTLSATGSLFLLNKNGIIIGADGRVLTGGAFVGSTRDITDEDFLNDGGFTLFGDNQAGVTNLGKISSIGGDVLLAGYTVTNRGTITAEEGRVGLTAGQRVDVLTDLSWLGGAYAVSLGERGNDITNEGRIQSLIAELRTHNGNIYALAGNNTGLIQATGVKNEGGKVILTSEGGTVQSSGTIVATRDANGGDIEITAANVENYGGTQDVSGATGGSIRIITDAITTDTEMLARGSSGPGGSINISATAEILFTSAGRIDASGATSGGSVTLASGPGVNVLSGQIAATSSAGLGGTVNLLGDRVSLLGTIVDASGATGGGTILAGGGYQGASVLSGVANASSTYVSDKSVLRADATGAHADGGSVVAWADGTTQFAGTITARSGTASGDGGLVETSGLEALGVSGTVDASARSASGANGQWLLDPKNITIGTITDSLTQFQSTVEGIGGQPADQHANANFGSSVDISGETAVVTGRLSAAQSHAGALYIFESGRIAARITGFLGSVAPSAQVDGDIVAAVDRGSTSSTFGAYFVSGSAYTFAKGTSWRSGVVNTTANPNTAPVSGQTPNQKSRLPNPVSSQAATGSDSFGQSFQLLRQNGNAVLYVADPSLDDPFRVLTDSGVVYRVNVNSDGTAFGYGQVELGTLTNQRFGQGLAASSEALFVTSGSATTSSRDLFIADLATGQSQVLPGVLPEHFNFFSTSVMATSGLDLFVNVQVGSPSFGINHASFFRDTANSNRLTLGSGFRVLNLSFIAPQTIAASGDTLLLTSSNNTNQNAVASFFQRPASGWASISSSTPLAPTFTYRDNTTGSGGNAVAAIDGDYAILGTPLISTGGINGVGGAVQFRRTGGVWSNVGALNAADIYPVSSYGATIAAEGTTTVIGDGAFGDQVPGGDQNGRVYVYENGALAAILSGTQSGISSSLGLGDRVAISGNRIAATAAGSAGGSAFQVISLYDKGTGWRNGSQNRVSSYTDFPPNNSFNALLDTSLALDGDTLAFARPLAEGTFETGTGRVLVFSNIGAGLADPAIIRSPGGALTTSQNYFGSSLALSGNTLAIGQSAPDSFRVANGFENNVYLYENLSNSWSGLTPTRISANTFFSTANERFGFGTSLGLENNTLAINAPAVGTTSSSVYIFERTNTWSAATTPVAKLAVPGSFGFGASLDLEGDKIAITAASTVGSSAASSFSTAYLFDKQGQWRDGAANQIATFVSPNPIFLQSGAGPNIALSGNTVLIASVQANRQIQPTSQPIYTFTGPFDFSSRASFGSNPGGNLNISAASLSASLSLGTDITLQANNDITVSAALIINNAQGDGGDLTLSAGRRILVNAPIFTDNGDLTLIANDPRADATYRDAGERVVVLGRDASNVGVTLNLGTGNLLISAADRFENRTGSTSPFVFSTVNPGRYLVFSTTPNQTGAPDAANLTADLATTNRNWVYYNQTFDVTNLTPSYLPAGNGFVYSVQPALNVSVGNASITYGQTVTANLSLTGLTLGGDTISQSVFGISPSDLPNLVTTGLASTVPLSPGGFAHAGNHTDAITAAAKSTVTTGSVFGVAVTTGTAGDLTIAKANLNVTPTNATRVYRDADPAFTFNYTGFVAGDNASVIDTAPGISTTATTSSDVGSYTLTALGGLDNNYNLVPSGTALLSITPAALSLTGLAGVNRVYDGTTVATFSGTPTIAPLGGDTISLSGVLTATASFADRHVGTNKGITLAGFGLTGAQAGNYTLVLPTNLTASITPASLSLSGLSVVGRVYDGTTTASVTGTAAVAPLAGDTVTVTGTPSASFLDENAAANKPVTLSGLTLGGTHSGNYVLAPSTLTGMITPRPLDITGLLANSRVYDATTAATLSGTATITPISGDVLSLTGTPTASFASKNVGTAIPVSVAGFSLAGTDALNYALNQPTGLFADISPASLAITGLSVVDRVYDASLLAQLVGTPTFAALGTDRVTLTGTPTATFADKHVGTGKSVTVAGFTLSGDDAANYSVVQPAGLTGTITARALAVTGLIASSKVYDTTAVASVVGTAVFSGILAGDLASINAGALVYAFGDPHVGTAKSISISGVTVTGDDAANYDATQFGLTADITPAALTVIGATAASRVYDATNLATVSGGALHGVLGSDSVTFSTTNATGTFLDKNVGTDKAVTATGYAISGSAAGNYTLVQPADLTASITPFAVNLAGLSGNKTYDGTTAAPLTFTGLNSVFALDTVTVDASAVSATYADKHAGTDKAITVTGLFALSGLDAANYALTQPADLVGTIARLGITVTGLTIADKIYDGTETGVISGTGSFGGTIAGDDLAINVGAINVTFADKNVGTNKAVALSGVTLSGADADNYTAATPTGITASISPRELTVTGLTALDKVYDRTATATLTGTGTLLGAIADDAIALDESIRAGVFSNKDAGTGKDVAVTGLTLTGDAARNYSLLAPTLTAAITPATATLIGLTAVNRIYDATTIVTFSGLAALDFGSLNNVLASSENVSLAGTATGSFADKNVGIAKAVTVAGVSLAGTDAANYTLALPTDLTANVTPADLAVTGTAVADKVYDANVAATISTPGSVTALASDTVTLVPAAATATFADKDVAANKAVAVSGYTLTGTDAANYTLLQPTGVTGTITRADLALTGIVADPKIYDGTTSVPLSGSLVIAPFGTDAVTLTGAPTATFADENVGTARPVTLTGLSLTGTDAANYNFILPALAANVTPRSVFIGGLTALNRVYDGTTLATLAGTATLANVVSGDSLGFNLAAITASFADKNAGADKRVFLDGSGLSGADAGNYTQVLPLDLVATITARVLQILGVDAVDRTYDRTTAVALTGGTLANTVAGDAVSLVTTNASGTMADKNVGVNKPVTASGYTVTGADAANYTLAQPTGVDATVTAFNLAITGLQVADKFFDGNTTATLSGGTLSGVLSGDAVNLVTPANAAAFVTSDVGLNKVVTLAGLTLTGDDAGNYVLPDAPTTLGNILSALRIITDVIPPEVLRASANTALETQRAALAAAAAKTPDALKETDFKKQISDTLNGIPVISPSQKILGIPLAQRTPDVADYIAATEAAQQAAENSRNLADAYRTGANLHKESVQAVNANARATQTEEGLRNTYLANITRVETELAKIEQNLVTVAEARRRIESLTSQIANATRLGRASEIAQFQQSIAEARGVIAGEAALLAQRATYTKEVAASRAELAASEAKLASLEKAKTDLAAKVTDLAADLATKLAASSAAKIDAKDKADKLDAVAAKSVDTLKAEEKKLADAKATLASEQAAALNSLTPEAAKSLAASAAEKLKAKEAASDSTARHLAKLKEKVESLESDIVKATESIRAITDGTVQGYVLSNSFGTRVESPADLESLKTRGTSFAAFTRFMPPEKAAGMFSNDMPTQVANISASGLAEKLSEAGVSFGEMPTNLKGKDGFADLDKPLTFAPDVEARLKAEMRAAKLLPTFNHPALDNLPLAVQVQLAAKIQRAVDTFVPPANMSAEELKIYQAKAQGEDVAAFVEGSFEIAGLDGVGQAMATLGGNAALKGFLGSAFAAKAEGKSTTEILGAGLAGALADLHAPEKGV